MPASPSVAEQLAAHSQALRHLAKDLVGSSDADDLVQDTALRALRSPPPEPAGLFAWLAKVMKNLAANRRRGARRRQRRERANGPPGEVPPAADEVAQRDHVRAVTEALWALPEPYQSTLVQRYYQDRTPAQIAERTATPLATVKSRLQRGLELLRATLARRDGSDWRAALVPAFGLPVHSPWLLPALSVASMTTLGKFAAAVAACGLVAFAWWVCAPVAPPLPPLADARAGEPAPATAIAKGDERPAAESRVAAAPVAAAGADLAQPFAFELKCRVVDAEGLPITGAKIALAPPACALAYWPVATDGDGQVTLTWRGRAPAMTIAVGLTHDGANTGLQQLAVRAGEPAELRFVAGLSPLPVSVEVDARGRQVVRIPECSQGGHDCRECHQAIAGPDVFAVRGQLRAGLHPDAVFGDRLAVPPPSDDGPEFRIGVSGPGHFGLAPSAPGTPRDRVVEGRVFGADGVPLGGVAVALCRQPGQPFARLRTRADGSFRQTGVDPGPIEVIAGGGPEGRVARALEVVAGQTAHCELLLQTGRALRGSATARDGRPLVGARVEYLAPAGGDGDAATVGPDGRFAFANLPPGPGRLLLWGVAGEALPIAEEAAVLPDAGDVVFDLRRRPGATGGLRLFVHGHDNQLATDLEVRAWQQATRRGVFLTRQPDGAFHVHGLAAGFYRLEVGAVASGCRDLGEHWVDGENLADLGIVQLATPVRLAIDRDGDRDVEALELYARGASDVRADEVAAATRTLLLPPGHWLALWKHDGVLAARELTLVTGTDANLRLVR